MPSESSPRRTAATPAGIEQTSKPCWGSGRKFRARRISASLTSCLPPVALSFSPIVRPAPVDRRHAPLEAHFLVFRIGRIVPVGVVAHQFPVGRPLHLLAAGDDV